VFDGGGRGWERDLRVLVDEGGGVIDFVVDHDVQIFLAAVLGHVGEGQLFRHFVWCVDVFCWGVKRSPAVYGEISRGLQSRISLLLRCMCSLCRDNRGEVGEENRNLK
jgi:hypothetical protein